MHGVPGFEAGDGAEDLEFERLDEDAAVAIADEWFGIVATAATRLDTERDDSFRLATRRGDRALKIAHPADSWASIDMQLRALLHASEVDRTLPLQRVIHPSAGGLAVGLSSGRIARMFEWLPGELLLDATTGPDELASLGDALGRLSRALSSFESLEAARSSAWDLQTVPRLRLLLEELPNDAAGAAIDRFEERVSPRLGELPTQVIHNDFNPGNVLVDPNAPEFVVGILDFGDVVHSIRVADLAVAACYQLSPMRHNWLDLGPMIEAFAMRVPLLEVERELLPDLVAARFAQRILMNGWLSRQDGDSNGLHDANVSALTALLNLEV